MCPRHIHSAALSAFDEVTAPELPDLKSVRPVTCRSHTDAKGQHGAAAAAAATSQHGAGEAMESCSSPADGGAGKPTTLFRQIRLHNGSVHLAWLIAVDVLPAMPRVFSYHDDCGLTASGRLSGGGGGGGAGPQGLLLRAGNDYTVAIAATIAVDGDKTCGLAPSTACCISNLPHASFAAYPLIYA